MHLAKYYSEMQPDQDAILLLSHQAIFDHPIALGSENWDLVFDQMPDFVRFLTIQAPETHVHVTRHVSVTAFYAIPGIYRIVPVSMRPLVRIATNRPYFDAGLQHLSELAKALISGHAVLVGCAQ